MCGRQILYELPGRMSVLPADQVIKLELWVTYSSNLEISKSKYDKQKGGYAKVKLLVMMTD